MAEGLSVVSLSHNTDPEGRFQQIWLIVQAGEAYWVLRMEQVRQAGDGSLDRVMTDASTIYSGAPTTTVSAPHLAGRVVDIVADGRPVLGVQLDNSGAATLDFAASSIICGLPFPAYFTTFDQEAGSSNGTAQNKLRRISRIDLLLESADGIEVSCQGVTRKLELGTTTSPTDTAFPLFSGAKAIEMQGNHDRTGPITVRRYLPKPATVLALIAYQQVSER